VVTRKDLYPGAQIAQSLHAFREFINDYPELENEWYRNSNYIAILAAKDEDDLFKLCCRLDKKGIRYSQFREPDFDNQLTAIALEPGDNSRRATSSLPLALKNCKVGE
jgi:hypothetical protein